MPEQKTMQQALEELRSAMKEFLTTLEVQIYIIRKMEELLKNIEENKK